ncbi:hypothetical protein Patl1_22835 [Pistacia atlantica]|uniref:Uncharacterized protein n=1 Tax=Pistacia atlantica TaxID=434234 RepID=A0ACC0ZWR8_9ROSI|nr:hypothetical protein Patl1_22835 [Pistacia atlantica]
MNILSLDNIVNIFLLGVADRYVTAGTAWLNGAFSKVARAGQTAGTKTREKFNVAVSNLTAKDPPIAV